VLLNSNPAWDAFNIPNDGWLYGRAQVALEEERNASSRDRRRDA
jgi:hypothetical protein